MVEQAGRASFLRFQAAGQQQRSVYAVASTVRLVQSSLHYQMS